MHKRQFIRQMALATVGAGFGMEALAAKFAEVKHLSPDALASDDAFWNGIRQQYMLKPDYINLENGYYNFVPQPILDKYLQHIRDINYQGS